VAAKPRVYRESVRAGLADLLAAVAGGGQPLVSPADGWHSLAVALAAQDAADTGAAARPATLAPDLAAATRTGGSAPDLAAGTRVGGSPPDLEAGKRGWRSPDPPGEAEVSGSRP
jgi:hypothetical protein